MRISSLLIVCGVLFAHAVWAKGQACVVEDTYTVGAFTAGKAECLANNGLPSDAFKVHCKSLTSTNGRLTFVNACPLPSQGACDMGAVKPITFYYYAMPDVVATAVRNACINHGGTWK